MNLPPGFWPILAIAAVVTGPLALYFGRGSARQPNLAESAKTVTIKRSEYAKIGQINRNLVKENAQLNQQLGYFRNLVMERLNETTDKVYQRCLEIQAAKPEAGLTHKLYIPFRKDFREQYNQGSSYLEEVKLQDFVQVLPSHQQWCRERGLVLSEYLKRMPLAKALDVLRFDILSNHCDETSFGNDHEIYDVADYWEPSIYFWYLKQGDCESHTATLQALFLAAGLTGLLEMLTWNSCGMTYQGTGHSTIYAYSVISQRWHHLEPLGLQAGSCLSDLPAMYDSSDESNLETFTLSFNSQLTRVEAPVQVL